VTEARMIIWVEHVEFIRKTRNRYKHLVRTHLGRSMHKLEDNIKKDIREIQCELDSPDSG
jgi:hypothetical protein